MMPVPLLTFLAALFQVPKHTLFRSKVQDLDELFQPLENVEEDDVPQINQSAQGEQPLQEQHYNWLRDHRSAQLHCLFRMIVYNIHSGVKRTTLHMMLGHALDAGDRSKIILIAFNRIGSCTSYQTKISARNLLASYLVKCLVEGEHPYRVLSRGMITP